MYKQAEEFHQLPIAIPADAIGNLPLEYSFLKISPHNLILSALKKAEDEEAIILRFFETKGEATQTEVELFRDIKKLTLVDLLEREQSNLPFNRNHFSLMVKPFEIVTLKIKL